MAMHFSTCFCATVIAGLIFTHVVPADERLQRLGNKSTNSLPLLETIALCYWQAPFKLQARGNPEASDRVRRLIGTLDDIPRDVDKSERTQQTQIPRNAIMLLGCIGNDDDAKFLRDIVLKELRFDAPDFSVVSKAIYAIGILANRGSESASKTLASWMSWKDWAEELDLREWRDGDAFQQAQYYRLISGILYAAALDQSEQLEPALESLTTFLTTDEQRQWKLQNTTLAKLKAHRQSWDKWLRETVHDKELCLATLAIRDIPTEVVTLLELDKELENAASRIAAAERGMKLPPPPKKLS